MQTNGGAIGRSAFAMILCEIPSFPFASDLKCDTTRMTSLTITGLKENPIVLAESITLCAFEYFSLGEMEMLAKYEFISSVVNPCNSSLGEGNRPRL